jgi:hypothetical protein
MYGCRPLQHGVVSLLKTRLKNAAVSGWLSEIRSSATTLDKNEGVELERPGGEPDDSRSHPGSCGSLCYWRPVKAAQ